MNIRDIRTFLKLEELRNFGKTAEELFISQTTVSARIKALENELDTVLFTRSTHYVDLTPAGHQFLPYAKSIASTMENARQELVFYNRFERYATIAAPESIWNAQFVSALSSLVKNHTNIYFKLLCDHSSNILPKVLDHTVDIGFTLHQPHYTEIKSIPIRSSDFHLVASPELSLKHSIMTPDNVIDFPLIDMLWGKDFDTWFSTYYPIITYKMAVDRTSILTKFLLNGDGVAFLPERHVREYLDSGQLISIPFEYKEFLPTESCYAVYLEGNSNITLPLIEEIRSLL